MSRFMVCIALLMLFICSITLSKVEHSGDRKRRKKISMEDGPVMFLDDVKTSGSQTDKIKDHSYQTMYGMFLYQIRDRAIQRNEKVKMLEVGLGCGMPYGTGASNAVWKQIFGASNTLDLWVTDIDAKCIEKLRAAGGLEGVSSMAGDQSKPEDIMAWVKASGGNFSVIVDDGGHKTTYIKNTFEVLWNHGLAPGGLYFIEDLFLQRTNPFEDVYPFADVINAWIEQLLMAECQWPCKKETVPQSVMEIRKKFPLPKGIKFILCQREACMLAKCNTDDVSVCS